MKGRFTVFFILSFLSTSLQQASLAQCNVNTVPPVSAGCSVGDAIDAFSLAGITTTGNYGCSNSMAYSMITNQVRTLEVGNTYAFTATAGTSGNYTYPQYFAIWIDLNNDNVYDSTEMLYSSASSSTYHSGTITIPMYASQGSNMYMRTRCSYVSKILPNQACTQFVYGETEDYYVDIIQQCTTPVIVSQPKDTLVNCGFGNARFSVNAAPVNSNLNYQWQQQSGSSWFNLVNNGTYNGTTSKILDITGYTPDFDGNKYRCVVNNSCGAVATNTVELNIASSPIAQQPASQSTCEGSPITIPFIMGASSGSVHTYQWYIKTAPNTVNALAAGGIYSGVDTPLLVIGNVNASMAGYEYFCSVDGGCWNTDTVALTVHKLPVINSQPAADTVCVDEAAVFTVSASGTNLQYQWQYLNASNWQNLSNNTIYNNVKTNTLIVKNPDLNNNGKVYRCKIAGTCDTVYTQPTPLTVYDGFAIVAQPHDSTACINTTATFRVTTMSSSPVNYQWMTITSTGLHVPIDTPLYLNSSAAEMTVLTTTKKLDSTRYYCIISNRCKTDTTIVVRLYADPCGNDNIETDVKGINKTDNPIKIYPNPASGGKINILSSFTSRQAMVKVMNRMGVTKLSGTYDVQENKVITLDIDALPHGVYSILVYELENPVPQTVRFIKE